MRMPVQASPIDRRDILRSVIERSNASPEQVSPSDCPAGSTPCGAGLLGSSNICCPEGTYCASQLAAGGRGGNILYYCSPSCFPAAATVLDKAGRLRKMTDLVIGDQVQVVLPDGSLGFEDIYLFTHKDSQAITQYMRINLKSGRSLTLSPRHFVPVQGSRGETWANRTFKAAAEIKAGELIWDCTETGKIRPAVVAAIEEVKEAGVFNPLTFSGTIVVNGVAASAHSDWFLDGVVSVPFQNRVYQALFAPVRVIYRLIGPAWSRKIAEEWGVVDFVREKTTGQALSSS